MRRGWERKGEGVAMPRPRRTRICNKEIRRIIESTMAAEGLSCCDLAQRLDRDESSVTQFIRNVGTRKHQLRVVTQFSLALNRPGNWLLGILQERGLR